MIYYKLPVLHTYKDFKNVKKEQRSSLRDDIPLFNGYDVDISVSGQIEVSNQVDVCDQCR